MWVQKTRALPVRIFLHPRCIGTEEELLFPKLKFWHEKLILFADETSEIYANQVFNYKQNSSEKTSFSRLFRKTFLIKVVFPLQDTIQQPLFCTKYYMKAESGLEKSAEHLALCSKFEKIL